MIRNLLKKINSKKTPVELREGMQEFIDEIDKKSSEIETEKEKIREEFKDGARITKHRFTV